MSRRFPACPHSTVPPVEPFRCGEWHRATRFVGNNGEKMKFQNFNRISALLILFVPAILIFADATSHSAPQREEQKPEVISFLGKKLYAVPAQGEELLNLENDLKGALKAVEADPENTDNIILYGRSLAALWRYHEAIEVFSKGIEIHPDVALLYRHRGHRYISIREFDKAVTDLTKAARLDERSFDIWYHLGLAHYLKGEFDKARPAYESCLKTAEDEDSKVAVSNWLYVTLRRLGLREDAAKVLEGITEGMKVEENTSYYILLLFYKGLKSEEETVAQAEASDLDFATVAYGVGCWHLSNGQSEKARTYFEKVMTKRYWPAFGFIASEVELFRMKS
jgi:tetratricopeptide (TPR) repeat protein